MTTTMTPTNTEWSVQMPTDQNPLPGSTWDPPSVPQQTSPSEIPIARASGPGTPRTWTAYQRFYTTMSPILVQFNNLQWLVAQTVRHIDQKTKSCETIQVDWTVLYTSVAYNGIGWKTS